MLQISHYPAIFLLQSEREDYQVIFPDFPKCSALGRGYDDALRKARRALSLHVQYLLHQGKELPMPSPMERILPRVPQTSLVVMVKPEAESLANLGGKKIFPV